MSQTLAGNARLHLRASQRECPKQMFMDCLIPRLSGEWIQEVRKARTGGFLGQILACDPYFRTLEFFAFPAENWFRGRSQG